MLGVALVDHAGAGFPPLRDWVLQRVVPSARGESFVRGTFGGGFFFWMLVELRLQGLSGYF